MDAGISAEPEMTKIFENNEQNQRFNNYYSREVPSNTRNRKKMFLIISGQELGFKIEKI